MFQWLRVTFASLKYPNYLLLWLGQVSTSMGLWMDQVTQGWLMYEITASPLMLGLTGAFKGAPLIVFGIIAGVTADRYGKKWQLIAAQSLNGASNLVMLILVAGHWIQPWHILVVAALNGTAQAFQQPARQAMVSDLVDGRHLTNAIALSSVGYNASRIVGPAIIGFVLALSGVTGAYAVQTVIYFLATVFTFKLTFPVRDSGGAAPEQRSSILQDTKTGFAYIKSDKTILALMALTLVPTIMGMPYINMMPIFAKDVFKIGPEGLGMLLGVTGLGSIVGAMLVAGHIGEGKKGKLLFVVAVIFGIAVAAFALSPWLVLALPMLVAAGLTATGFNVLTNTLIQTHTPYELRGRVLGVYFLDRGLMPLGTLLAGAMADFMGAPLTLGVQGTVCALFAIGIAVSVPRIRQLP